MDVTLYKTTIAAHPSITSPSFHWLRTVQWEHETFRIFDYFLNKDNTLIDIGGWIGMMAIYGGLLCNKVYSIEPDVEAIDDFKKNLEINNLTNCEICEKPIYNTLTKLYFGPNANNNSQILNDSTSQVKVHKVNDKDYEVDTITFDNFMAEYNIEVDKIGLIKIDIEGGEEFIIQDVFSYFTGDNKPPIYLSFHYCWWKTQNLENFIDLFSKYKFMYAEEKVITLNQIVDTVNRSNFVSILFSDVEYSIK